MSLEQWMSDYTIDNNGTLQDLEFNVQQLIGHIDPYSVSE
jgi:dephospho-CoA kinase